MFTPMQIVGVAAVILPMLALCVGLAIAARRRRAAEYAEFAQVVATPASPDIKDLIP
ncbi:MAG: hypothetical protein JWP86_726 [Phenylobacterium sp.]|nr:hypothetical protein [Phenylobacterium sp.]MDB5493389.1 hypothetical protein [Phenylobacterium sp.]